MYFSKSAVLAFISAASAANFNVLVGQNGQLTFTPQTVQAAVGDTVTYTFLTQNHTVTSGTPGQGCAPDGTFNSGFIPIPSAGAAAAAPAASSAAGATTGKTGKAGKAGKAARAKGNFVVRGMNNVFDARGALEERQNTQPNFVVKVTSTQPQVFYCAQAQHCQVGMVGVINPSANGATSLNAYQQLSAQANTNQLPNTKAGTGGTLNAAAKAAIANGKNAAAAAPAATSTAAAAGTKTTKAAKKGAKGAAAALAAAKGKGN